MEFIRYTVRDTLRPSTVRYTGGSGGTGGGIPPNALVDRDGNPILDANGDYILVGHDPAPAPGSWEYADLATAESSGDAWQDGDDIQITDGALFQYRSDVAVQSYSGLIHKYPFDGTGVLGTLDTTATRSDSTPQNVDPDTWTGWTKTGDGITDVNGGRSRIVASAVDTSMASGNNLNSPLFGIIPNLSASYIDDGLSFQHRSAVRIMLSRTQNLGMSMNAAIGYGNTWWMEGPNSTFTDTGKAIATEHRAWLYMNDTRWSVWFDDDATPAVMSTQFDTADIPNPDLVIRSTRSNAEYRGIAKLTQAVYGGFTTS
jgi:hypothetical protein